MGRYYLPVQIGRSDIIGVYTDCSTDALLAEAAKLVAGQEKAADLLYILEVIREARSGDSWNSFWWLWATRLGTLTACATAILSTPAR